MQEKRDNIGGDIFGAIRGASTTAMLLVPPERENGRTQSPAEINATLTGLEPATSAVTGRRANQLRHRAINTSITRVLIALSSSLGEPLERVRTLHRTQNVHKSPRQGRFLSEKSAKNALNRHGATGDPRNLRNRRLRMRFLSPFGGYADMSDLDRCDGYQLIIFFRVPATA